MRYYRVYRECCECDQDVLVALRVNKSAALKCAARLNAISKAITPAEVTAKAAPVYYVVREPNWRDIDDAAD